MSRHSADDPAARLAALESQLAGQRARIAHLEAELAAERERRTAAERAVQQRSAELHNLAATLRQRTQELRLHEANLRAWEARWRTLEGSLAWRVVAALQAARRTVAPPASRREHALSQLGWWLGLGHQAGLRPTLARLRQALAAGWQRHAPQRLGPGACPSSGRPGAPVSTMERVPARQPEARPLSAAVGRDAITVDIIVCIHNAQADAERCLESVLVHNSAPYRLILVDDGSEPATAAWIRSTAERTGAVYLRNEQARGYTRAANQGLRASRGAYVVLLNSDTIVTSQWLDRLLACAVSDPKIGLVGPLSNTASWQSVPDVFDNGDWAANPLPAGMDLEHWSALLAADSGQLYPELPFLNGFCLLIKRAVLEAVGLFDEQHFGEGYGEENDFALRARAAGWRLAVADDAYVWHAQSASYSSDRRRALCTRAAEELVRKHGRAASDQGVRICAESLLLAGIRARARVLAEREDWRQRGTDCFAGRRLLFLMPVQKAGGGANVVLTEARAMQAMGVEVALVNWQKFRHDFEASYRLDIPVLYTTEHAFGEFLRQHAGAFDAMVATVFSSIPALAEVATSPEGSHLAFGYYIQDFEPYFFAPGSERFHAAWRSYTAVPNLTRFTKTDWLQRELEALVGVPSSVVGPSVDVGRFRPRRHGVGETGAAPVRVVAMIRPETPYRAPRLTMEVLRDAARAFGSAIDIVLFGCRREDPAFLALPHDFPHHHAGLLGPDEVARLLGSADVFVDYSSYQAMGLTALEAMASGAAVIVPALGGAGSFARHGQNALLLDTTQPAACLQALAQLVQDASLRHRLASQAIADAVRYYPEGPAFRILEALFGQA